VGTVHPWHVSEREPPR